MQNAPFPAPESMSHFYIVIAVALLICGLCVALAVVYIRLYKKLKAESQARQVALAELEEALLQDYALTGQKGQVPFLTSVLKNSHNPYLPGKSGNHRQLRFVDKGV